MAKCYTKQVRQIFRPKPIQVTQQENKLRVCVKNTAIITLLLIFIVMAVGIWMTFQRLLEQPIGKLVTDELLQQGHEVTAFARNPQALGRSAPDLQIWAGDAMDAQSVADAIKGHDAVVVTLGAGMNRKSKIRSQGTLNIIRGMQSLTKPR